MLTYKIGTSTEPNEDDPINYLHGQAAFEAMDLLDEDQIKEFLPLTNVDTDDEKDPLFIKEYKRFLYKNDLDLTHLSRSVNFNLTESLQQTK